jgi:hypothetical protein
LASAAAERRKASGSRYGPLPRSDRMATFDRVMRTWTVRLSALRLPSGEAKFVARVEQRETRELRSSFITVPGFRSTQSGLRINSDAERIARTNRLFLPARSAGGGDHPKGGGGACGADDSLGMRRTCCDVRLLAASPASGISLGVRASRTVFIRCRLDPGSVIKRMPVFADFRIHQPSHAVDHTQRFMFRQTVPGIER